MELLFVTVIAAALGALVRYIVPGRGAYGILLLPGIAAVVAAVLWAGLTWLGWTFDGGWIWLVSIGAAIVAAAVGALLLVRVRAQSDDRMLHRLTGGKA
ncbi:MAG: hypothetical protein KF727_05940 [Microbacteriaceae bacterium]|nr:hypothetical protein [Microbacteriaceae bacterium]